MSLCHRFRLGVKVSPVPWRLHIDAMSTDSGKRLVANHNQENICSTNCERDEMPVGGVAHTGAPEGTPLQRHVLPVDNLIPPLHLPGGARVNKEIKPAKRNKTKRTEWSFSRIRIIKKRHNF